MATTKGEIVEQFRCQSIREAAMRVVSRKGYDHVTVQDIADEAGVAKGTVYLYFKSREDVLEKTMSFSFEEFHILIREAIGRGTTFRERVEQVVQAQLAYFEQKQEFFRLYLAMAEPLGERRLRKHTSYRTHIAQLVSMVEMAVEKDEVRAQPPERIAIALASVVRDIGLQRMAEKNKRPIAEDIEFVRDFICRGIATPEEKST
ncbi:MAG TPA: TetR/AcrR family transcriptional regulator [Thermoanaerobaculia bacterium]|jgi:TetR/AcrR family fatty acid metabolism transcriptional regulator|nr:TetR/AcrR family transcriptional regulator [Thermoanaerobaculia bacterium]